jgi:hypothetical protein
MDRRRRSRAPRRTPPHRHLLALIAIAVGLLQVFGLGHLVFVSHAICEHGALLHVEGEAAHADEAPAEAKGVASARPGQAAEDHQHCGALAVRPAVIAVQPAFAAFVPIAIALTEDAPPALDPFPPIGVLALAPKSSPPIRPSFPSV